MPFLPRSSQSIVLAILLLCAIGVFYGMPPQRPVNLTSPLSSLPQTLPGWILLDQGTVAADVENVLRADQTLIRDYINTSTSERANLFIAFFRSQATGAAPHSPKNCLPGAGWIASQSDIIHIPVPGMPEAIPVNRYIVSKGDARAMVVYWYQSHNRAVASEYWAKLFLVYDSIRLHRSDTSIVRVIVPISGTEQQAEKAAISFVRSAFGPIRHLLPA
jgi:EpsI family protein